MLTNAQLLVFPQFDRGFMLETDTSGKGLGAVLSQEQSAASVPPIVDAGSKLQPCEKIKESQSQKHPKLCGRWSISGLSSMAIIATCILTMKT